MDKKLNIMVGFPNTGKTTFIAALWKYLKDVKNNCFELDHLPSNIEYLEQLVESWLQCNLVARTTSGQQEEVKFTVKTSDGKSIDIIIPDIAGEIYHNLFLAREIEKNLFTSLSAANGIIVFINSQLEDVSSHNRFGVIVPSDAEKNPSKTLPFSPSDTPIRIQLVDVLQSILDINNNNIKVSVVISAWDLIEDVITPNEWFQINIPFVYNFIKNNFAEFRCFGISAQGGDYESQKEVLLSMDLPIDRIKVFDGKNCSNDITLPLQYLIK